MSSITLVGCILVGLFIFIWSRLFAPLEIQTEGGVGWGLAAPTWRKMSKIYSAIMNGKELTGYHLIMFFLPLYLLLGTFILDRYWSGEWRLISLRNVFQIASWYFIMGVSWDFMWFPLNPYFGIERFRRGEIHWHRKWIWRVPVDYVGGIVGAAVLTGVADVLGAGHAIWLQQAVILGVVAIGVLVTVRLAPASQRWQKRMRAEHVLTEDWKLWLTEGEHAEMLHLLKRMEDTRVAIAGLGRTRAQREQLGVPKPGMTDISRTS